MTRTFDDPSWVPLVTGPDVQVTIHLSWGESLARVKPAMDQDAVSPNQNASPATVSQTCTVYVFYFEANKGQEKYLRWKLTSDLAEFGRIGRRIQSAERQSRSSSATRTIQRHRQAGCFRLHFTLLTFDCDSFCRRCAMCLFC